MSTDINQLLATAAGPPPPLDVAAVARRAQRRRLHRRVASAVGALAVVGAVGGIAGVAARRGAETVRVAGQPSEAATLTLAADGAVWPAAGQRPATVAALGGRFAHDVLGWDAASVSADDAPDDGPRVVHIERGDGGAAVELVAEPSPAGWAVMHTGRGVELTRVSAEETALGVDMSARATALRWWVLAGGAQQHGTAPAGRPVPLRESIAEIRAALVVALDDTGQVVDVAASVYPS